MIERARLRGNGRRAALVAGLSHVVTGDLAGSEETLLIARVRSLNPLVSGRPASDFGEKLTAQLRILRAQAPVDPAGHVDGAVALRFTSTARYAAWRIGVWIEGSTGVSASSVVPMPDLAATRTWVLAEVLAKGQALLPVVRILRERRMLTPWIARFDARDLATARNTIERDFGLPLRTSSPTTGRYITESAPMARQDPGEQLLSREEITAQYQQIVDQVRRQWHRQLRADPAGLALQSPKAELLLVLVILSQHPQMARVLASDVIEKVIASVRAPEPIGQQAGRKAPTGPKSRPNASRRRIERRQTTRERPIAFNFGTPASQIPAPKALLRYSGLRYSGNTDAPLASEFEPVAPVPATVVNNDRGRVAVDPAPIAQHLETRFGGVFFLLNILLDCRLYPDFTRPLDPGVGPSPFWMLDRLSRHLFGVEYRSDPLCRWLGAIGCAGRLPRLWKVDPRWLARVPAGEYFFLPSRSRTILWDKRGFALLDSPQLSDEQAQQQCAKFAATGSMVPFVTRPRRRMPNYPGGRWVACLAEFLAARMALAGEGLGPASLRLDARLSLREDRVDLTFALDQLPLALRMAGLDRDPGWLPAEGRSVYFRFE